jgi:hypothetical protein
MGIYYYYSNHNYLNLLNNSKTNTIIEYQIKCYKNLELIIINLKNKIKNLLNNQYIYNNTSAELPESFVLYINDIIYLELYNIYNNINIYLLGNLIDIITLLIITNYNSQILIISDIVNINNTIYDYRTYVIDKIIQNSLDNTFKSLEIYTLPIINYDLDRNIAAICIQRNWRYINTNPKYNICKNRLNSEFTSLVVCF